MVSDTGDGSGNGGRYVTVREWERGRAEDGRLSQRDRDVAIGLAEERVMKALGDHSVASRQAHRDQDNRIVEVAKGLDGVQSTIDQLRGARNLVIFLVGANLAALVIALFAAFH